MCGVAPVRFSRIRVEETLSDTEAAFLRMADIAPPSRLKVRSLGDDCLTAYNA
jgi:hypothetical protein